MLKYRLANTIMRVVYLDVIHITFSLKGSIYVKSPETLNEILCCACTTVRLKASESEGQCIAPGRIGSSRALAS